MLLEGQFEGKVNLQDHCLTIGPKGQVKAEIRARQVIVSGSVEGNISADEKIEIRKTGRVVGDLLTAAIVIEEGGYFRGSIDLLREGEMPRAAGAPRPQEVRPKRREGLGAIGAGESPEIDQ
jgi:cytoskeletal protein CcmA (bactofilin family)